MNIQSESIDKIVEALSKAQGQIEVTVYDSVNPHFKSKYASYEALRATCRGPLSDNGLSLTHMLGSNEHGVRVMITQLSHTSGQWMRSCLTIPQSEKETPHQMGSLLTYSKRYSIACLLALASDQDDDAEKAQEPFRKILPPIKAPYAPMPEFPPEEEIMPISRPPEGVYVFPFGKHVGKPLNEVPKNYFSWLIAEGTFDKPQNQELANECKKLGLI